MDRYNSVLKSRMRLCRSCFNWLQIERFEWSFGAGKEKARRKVCRYCRNAQRNKQHANRFVADPARDIHFQLRDGMSKQFKASRTRSA